MTWTGLSLTVALWDIGVIDKLNELSGQERCDWINAHNTSSKIFKENDWKNAGRPKRQVNMLPDDFLKEKLSELINDIKK